MARKRSSSSSSSRVKKQKSTSPLLFVVLGVALLAVVGLVIWLCLPSDDYQFQRSDLDKYVEVTNTGETLGDGAAVYVDMSDGMNCAYAGAGSKAILQGIINKLAANKAIEFYGLADEKIFPLEMSHTELYNYMLNPASYGKQKAPIEKTLGEIVEKKQPALLMSDFEEYNRGVIHQAAYAKQYFIEWLEMGFNISFYKWDFVEGGKRKHMFLAVFDDNGNRLNALVDNAVKLVNPDIDTYVLGGHYFAYPAISSYPSLRQGGNYHDRNGVDNVTAVGEKGGPFDYVSYARPLATASGTQGQFSTLDNLVGVRAEYYPIGVSWESAIENARNMQEEGVPAEDMYTHLLRNLYFDFGAQDGYNIDGIEVRVFDMQATMKVVGDQILEGDIDVEEIEKVEKPEINMVLAAGMESAAGMPGWTEVFVDFDSKFNGTFMGGYPSSDLLRANIVIANATPDIPKAMAFFGWDGNPSLANSVKETLAASTSNPRGAILFTYYLKTWGE